MNEQLTVPFHRLRRLSVVGGFMDGLDIEFAPGLNCIIGGRGTGKTTILQFVRYALNLMPSEPAPRKQVQNLVDANLGGGRIRLAVETKEGLTYVISRTGGGEPAVLDSQGNSTDISLASGGFFRADIYGQNQVEGIADDPLSQLALMDTFEAEGIRQDDQAIQRVRGQLQSNAHECSEVQKVLAGLSDELNTLPSLETKLKEFKVTAGQDAEAVNLAHDKKAQRDREKRAVDSTLEFLREQEREIEALIGGITQGATLIFDREATAGQNSDAMNALYGIVNDCGHDIDQLLTQTRNRLTDSIAAFSTEAEKLAAAHKIQDMAFDDLIVKHKEAMGQSAERASLESRRNDLLAKKRLCEQKSKELQKLLQEREALLSRLSELRNHRFGLRKSVADRINAEVTPQIRVQVEQYGNIQNYQNLLETHLKNASLQHRVVAGKIAGRISPMDFTGAARSADVDMVVDRTEINPDQARKVIETLSGNSALYEFETVELVDFPSIELQDGDDYKDSLTTFHRSEMHVDPPDPAAGQRESVVGGPAGG